jgi:hypothetical protein
LRFGKLTAYKKLKFKNKSAHRNKSWRGNKIAPVYRQTTGTSHNAGRKVLSTKHYGQHCGCAANATFAPPLGSAHRERGMGTGKFRAKKLT